MDPEVERCFEDRKLRRGIPKKKWVSASIELAYNKIDNAEKAFKAGVYEFAFISAYTAMFHAIRAILFRDGIIEKSHYCMIRYALDKYGDKIEKKYIWTLDEYRERRHEILYGMKIREVSQEEAEEAIEIAREFIEKIEDILEGNK